MSWKRFFSPDRTALSPGAGASTPLLSPRDLAMNETAPPSFRARFETTKGMFVIDVHRDWAPAGANRFYNLVRNGFYDDVRFFRVITGFMVQFGIHGDPKVAAAWRSANIPDDVVKESNTRGMVTYATAGPNTRTTQVFVNYGNNARLNRQGFAPFGQVTEGMEVLDQLYAEYGEGAPAGGGPDQGKLERRGNEYLTKSFPKLDHVIRAVVVRE